jgi:hypothetical protein
MHQSTEPSEDARTRERAAALKAASDACYASPHRPESHYAYGQAWSALGNHANAERAFAAALELADVKAEIASQRPSITLTSER